MHEKHDVPSIVFYRTFAPAPLSCFGGFLSTRRPLPTLPIKNPVKNPPPSRRSRSSPSARSQAILPDGSGLLTSVTIALHIAPSIRGLRDSPRRRVGPSRTPGTPSAEALAAFNRNVRLLARSPSWPTAQVSPEPREGGSSVCSLAKRLYIGLRLHSTSCVPYM